MLLNKFHDENITSIDLKEDNLLLSIISKESVGYLILNGLKKLRVEGFQEGNIVNSIFIYSGEECKENESNVIDNLKYLYNIDNKSLDSNSNQISFINQQFKDLVSADLTLIEIEPSYGAYIIAIGKGIEYSRE